jgi:hypothetical protein
MGAGGGNWADMMDASVGVCVESPRVKVKLLGCTRFATRSMGGDDGKADVGSE